MGQAAENKRRRAAGADTHDHIAAAESAGVEVQGCRLGVVLRTFLRAEHGLGATGQNALHHFRGRLKGRRALHGVEHSQAPAGACAEVEEPAASLEARGDQTDGRFDGRR